MKEIFEGAFAMILAAIFASAIAICWYCAAAISLEVFAPIATILTVLAVLIIIGMIISGKEKK